MNYVSFEISLIALLPALFLCGFIYVKDKAEKEPIGLLAILFALGALCYFPSLIVQRIIASGFDKLFESNVVFSEDGVAEYVSGATYALHSFLISFFAIAVVEVLIKWSILYFCTRNNKHFNYLFDGIVYSVFISLGFAAIENLRFAWINGWDTLLMHLLSSVPAHLFVGILMGYYFSRWHVRRAAGRLEARLFEANKIKEIRIGSSKSRLALSLFLPVLARGAFIFTDSIDSKVLHMIFYFIVFLLYGVSFISIDRISSEDAPSKKFSEKLLKSKHPELSDSVNEEGEGS